MAGGRSHRGGALAIAAVAAVAAALGATACGGSSAGKEDPAKMPVTGPGAPQGAATPEAAIREFFAAKREGDAARGCSLESEDFQKAQYGSAGQACLDNLANKQQQKVWREEIKIDDLDEAPDSAAARIRPNSGSTTPAEITLVRGEGGWLVNSLR
jgi:hypothetical protein